MAEYGASNIKVLKDRECTLVTPLQKGFTTLYTKW